MPTLSGSSKGMRAHRTCYPARRAPLPIERRLKENLMHFPKLVLLPLLAAMAMPLQAQVLNYVGGPVMSLDPPPAPRPGNFDGVTKRYFDWMYGLEAPNRKNNFALTSINGRSAFRMTLSPGDPLDAYNTMRAEVTPSRERTRQGRRWYAGGVFFPAESADDPAWSTGLEEEWIVLFQLHSSQGILATSPPMAIVAKGKELVMESRANHIDKYAVTVQDKVVKISSDATKENTSHQKIRLAEIQRNQWYCFVIDANWQHELGKGAFRLWMNGELVYEAQNVSTHYMNVDLPTAGNNPGNYPKTGIYFSAFGDPQHSRPRVIYTDFIHIGGAHSSYEQMAERTPCGVHPQPTRGVAY
ncbi:heparin lyase I family protein [Massilia sp. erpn]|uniref:heparin lyase I family protein n=1 Tax=Massilia sp. erpn TaxID=2738142 RepID=UPI00210413F2|nr:heparin lyase I family protein [Massilia sp. erpn]UTY60500.1 hypothetical protein HPQ68_26875 [Massilia sp. erpn]